MAAHDSSQNGISFSMSEPSLREQAPLSLRRAGPLKNSFVAANDRGAETANKTREDSRGSEMVKRSKPFPELKPKFAHQVKKSCFDQDWIREQRVEKMHQFERQREIAIPQKRLSERSLER